MLDWSRPALYQADFLCPLAYRDQHDVDDADRAQAKRHQAYPAQEHIHHVKDYAYSFRALHGVPVFEGVLVLGIETVIARDDTAHFVPRYEMFFATPGR